jgi:hypothetical protein
MGCCVGRQSPPPDVAPESSPDPTIQVPGAHPVPSPQQGPNDGIELAHRTAADSEVGRTSVESYDSLDAPASGARPAPSPPRTAAFAIGDPSSGDASASVASPPPQQHQQPVAAVDNRGTAEGNDADWDDWDDEPDEDRGADASVDDASPAPALVTTAVRCSKCSERVVELPGRRWSDSVDYLFTRTHYPDARKLGGKTAADAGAVAWACQCTSATGERTRAGSSGSGTLPLPEDQHEHWHAAYSKNRNSRRTAEN